MTSLTLQLDNVDLCRSNSACDSADQITKLFPKCRPRSDVNLNPILISSISITTAPTTITTADTTREHELIETPIEAVMNVERCADR